MLVCCGILLFFLMMAMIMTKQLNVREKNSEKIIATSLSIKDIEDNIRKAGLEYYHDYYKNGLIGNTTITVENLKYKNYLTDDDLKLEKGKGCNGYVLISQDDNNLTAKAFALCENDMTAGFQMWRLGA